MTRHTDMELIEKAFRNDEPLDFEALIAGHEGHDPDECEFANKEKMAKLKQVFDTRNLLLEAKKNPDILSTGEARMKMKESINILKDLDGNAYEKSMSSLGLEVNEDLNEENAGVEKLFVRDGKKTDSPYRKQEDRDNHAGHQHIHKTVYMGSFLAGFFLACGMFALVVIGVAMASH